MDKVNGYEIQKEAVFENGRGFALGHNPKASPPYGILHFTVMADGQRNFYGITSHNQIQTPERQFEKFLSTYGEFYQVAPLGEGREPGREYYRYYTRYPLDVNTFPKGKELGILEIAPYEKRTLVEGGTIQTWGEVLYTKPLPESLIDSYELAPAPSNPDRAERPSITAQLKEAAGRTQKSKEPEKQRHHKAHEGR